MTAATAVLGYTLRACLPLRRWWLLALPCVGAVLFGLLARVSEDTPERGAPSLRPGAIGWWPV